MIIKYFMFKNQKILIGIVLAIAAAGVLVWIGRPSPSSDSAPLANFVGKTSNALAAEENQYDFGTISMAAGKVAYGFTIKNSSDASLTLNKIYTSCMCTVAVLSIGEQKKGPFGMPGHGIVPKINETLAAGGSATVEVTFDPTAHGPAGVGKIARVVYIENSAGDPLELGISATVTP